MRIPEVRKRLSQAADDLRTGARKPEAIAKELDFLVTELWRKKGRRKVGKPIRTPLTPEKKQEIREFARVHKDYDLQEIANHFNVNPGRVSEIVSGHRK
jgi:hypothetical protein